MKENQSENTAGCELGSEADVERITGRKRKTLQKDRLAGRGFPFYRLRGQILYDLNEVRGIIRAGRVNGDGESGPANTQRSPNDGGLAA